MFLSPPFFFFFLAGGPSPPSLPFFLADWRDPLSELRLHYTTIGSPTRDASGVTRNAVLIMHGTTGNGRGFLTQGFAGELFGPGQLLDAAKHYISTFGAR